MSRSLVPHHASRLLFAVLFVGGLMPMLTASAVDAATFDVDGGAGVDSGTCGSILPCKTIGQAVNNVASGGSIAVIAGTYTENLTIGKSLTITGTTSGATIIDGNQAGTVITIGSGTTVTLSTLTIRNGKGAAGSSGLTGSNSQFAGFGGSGGNGGAGGIANAGNLTLVNVTVSGNTGGGGGTGGIGATGSSGGPGGYVSGGHGGAGGAGGIATASTTSSAALIATNVTVSGNTGGAGGAGGAGGSGFGGGTGGNGSPGAAGGIAAYGILIAANVTLGRNIGAAGGAGGAGGANPGGVPGDPGSGSIIGPDSIDVPGPHTAILVNSIVAGTSRNCSFPVTDSGHNLEFPGNTCFTASSAVFADPKLGPLAPNGGPTQTMALLAGSPAIDAGDNAAVNSTPFPGLPATDQRGTGFPRIVDGTVDIGAFEYTFPNGPPPAATATTLSVLGSPQRIIDTRPGATDACITPGTPIAQGIALKISLVSPCSGIPASATGIIGNLTAVNAVAPGYLTAFPGGAVPPTSNVNFLDRMPVPNNVTVAIASDGSISVYTSAQTDIILDIAAYLVPNGVSVQRSSTPTGSTVKAQAVSTGLRFHPLAKPVRLFDSRPGVSACFSRNTPLAANVSINLTAVFACTGIPAGAQAIVGNGTVVAPGTTEPGYVSFYPGGIPVPTVSNLNYVPSQTVPNAFVVGLNNGGTFNAVASTGTDLVIDVTGYYDTAASGLYLHFLPTPVRLLDTRAGQAACTAPGGPIGASATRNQIATTACTGVPAGAAAVIGNGTVVADVRGAGAGYVTFYPGGTTLPVASNLNYVPGQVVPNAFTVGLGADGSFNGYALTSVDLVIDLAGYYAAI